MCVDWLYRAQLDSSAFDVCVRVYNLAAGFRRRTVNFEVANKYAKFDLHFMAINIRDKKGTWETYHDCAVATKIPVE